MSWDDEDFAVPSGSKEKPVFISWVYEFAENDDEPVLESWEDEETAKPKPKAAAAAAAKSPKKASPSPAATPAATKNTMLDIDTLDDKTRKELLRKAELESDLNNAADIFGCIGVAEEHPRSRAER